ncbi:hypothetical protein ALP05_03224 [Pseudomonas caricapapayae]|uniref:SAF domain-containing protein n=1 Tax=Pseudomonas caricapapayae TaxID=46678 RepID=A0A3M6EX76_9PSED|nr:Flp pilus assembly protein CpaB [Pseudomonas caricapapayae]RMV72783.1 hypothetical protein ALP05_03224 [Pseudomonas caricapapayae]
MKKNSLLLLATAILMAAGIALLVRTLLAPRVAPAPTAAVAVAVAAHPGVYVLAAAELITPGDFIDGSLLTWKEVNGNPDRAQFYVRNQDKMETLFGATVRQQVQPGQPLRPNQVIRPGEPGYLAAVVSPGMRALSVPTALVESNFALVGPGDHVDVILALNRKDEGPDPRAAAAHLPVVPPLIASQTILRNVRVLAVNNLAAPVAIDRDLDPASKESKSAQDKAAKFPYSVQTVTFEVTPQQAEKLAVAKEAGMLQLALRSAQLAIADEETGDAPTAVTDLKATTAVYRSEAKPEAASAQLMFGKQAPKTQTFDR